MSMKIDSRSPGPSRFCSYACRRFMSRSSVTMRGGDRSNTAPMNCTRFGCRTSAKSLISLCTFPTLWGRRCPHVTPSPPLSLVPSNTAPHPPVPIFLPVKTSLPRILQTSVLCAASSFVLPSNSRCVASSRCKASSNCCSASWALLSNLWRSSWRQAAQPLEMFVGLLSSLTSLSVSRLSASSQRF